MHRPPLAWVITADIHQQIKKIWLQNNNNNNYYRTNSTVSDPTVPVAGTCTWNSLSQTVLIASNLPAWIQNMSKYLLMVLFMTQTTSVILDAPNHLFAVVVHDIKSITNCRLHTDWTQCRDSSKSGFHPQVVPTALQSVPGAHGLGLL